MILYTIQVVFVTLVSYHAIKMIVESLKSTEDVLIRRPATYFVTVIDRFACKNLAKILNYIHESNTHLTLPPNREV